MFFFLKLKMKNQNQNGAVITGVPNQHFKKLQLKPLHLLSQNIRQWKRNTVLPNSQRVATQAFRSLSESFPSSLPTDTRVAATDIGHKWGLTAITWQKKRNKSWYQPLPWIVYWQTTVQTEWELQTMEPFSHLILSTCNSNAHESSQVGGTCM